MNGSLNSTVLTTRSSSRRDAALSRSISRRRMASVAVRAVSRSSRTVPPLSDDRGLGDALAAPGEVRLVAGSGTDGAAFRFAAGASAPLPSTAASTRRGNDNLDAPSPRLQDRSMEASESAGIALRFATGPGAACPSAAPTQSRAVLTRGDLEAASPRLQGRITASSEPCGVAFRFATGAGAAFALARSAAAAPLRRAVLPLPIGSLGASSTRRGMVLTFEAVTVAGGAILFSFPSPAAVGRFVFGPSSPDSPGRFGLLAAAAAEGLETQAGFRVTRNARAGGVRAAAGEGTVVVAADPETQAGLRLARNARAGGVRAPPARRGGPRGGGRTVKSMASRGADSGGGKVNRRSGGLGCETQRAGGWHGRIEMIDHVGLAWVRRTAIGLSRSRAARATCFLTEKKMVTFRVDFLLEYN